MYSKTILLQSVANVLEITNVYNYPRIKTIFIFLLGRLGTCRYTILWFERMTFTMYLFWTFHCGVLRFPQHSKSWMNDSSVSVSLASNIYIYFSALPKMCGERDEKCLMWKLTFHVQTYRKMIILIVMFCPVPPCVSSGKCCANYMDLLDTFEDRKEDTTKNWRKYSIDRNKSWTRYQTERVRSSGRPRV